MKKQFAIAIGAALVLAAICGIALLFGTADTTDWYSQIDNAKIEQVKPSGGVIDPHGGLQYEYTLPAYNSQGQEKNVSFGTSRELREGAYIRLAVAPVRSVLEWSEVQYDELPAAVQSRYAAPADTAK